MSVEKDEARKAAFARRKTADPAGSGIACGHLVEAVRAAPGGVVSGFWPIRTEIDPRPALRELAATHSLCLPVVVGAAQPLAFRLYSPGAHLEEAGFGTMIPAGTAEATPDILIVPLAAFDDKGYRLGYGGGFYDRTLERLRAAAKVTAIGFAYSVQRVDSVPRDANDQPLDLIVTEDGIFLPGSSSC